MNADATGYILGKFLLQKLCPSRVVIEMARDEWDINVATLADGLPIVHRLKNRQQPGMLLHQPRDGIQVACASMRGERPPSRRRRPRGLDRGVNVSRRPLRNRG